jgi:transcriptional regulator with XRE-family HTH domain
VAVQLGGVVREERLRRGWSLRQLARRAGVSVGGAQEIEAGTRGSLEMYALLGHALGLRLEARLLGPRRRTVARGDEDPVHAAMGELEAAHLHSLGFSVAVDEPYQHYQFAGRADVVAWSTNDRALLHIENRTRFPNLQDAAGSFNAKRAYLAKVLADRWDVRGGFTTVTHAMVALWSAEVIHTVRLRGATFRSLCPDPAAAFEAWWAGHPPDPGQSSAFVLMDPFAASRARRFVDLEAVAAGVRPRVRGYADAVGRLRSGTA